MLVILTEEQLLSPAAICHDCPMASQNGLPRWQRGKLKCGRPIEKSALDKAPTQYECTMGFRVAELSDQ
ncbi:MAG: hypothetical protein AAGC93_15645 [Cyanobacteria bacterium P01_F01_bin.53]